MATVTAVVNHFPVAKEGFTTTLASTILSGAATVPLNSVTGYSNGDTAVLVIDPGNASKQVFTGVVDTTGVQLTGVKWTEGTNAPHTAGATVVDYVAATHMSMITKGILTSLDSDGTLKAGAVDNVAVLAAAVQAFLVPTAAIQPYAGLTEPTGWLFCYGQAISRTTYATLFTAVSTTYGVGDGSTTFNLPDLRGRVIAGQDDMGGTSANRLTNPGTTIGGIDGDVLGATGGAETHVLTVAQLAAHSHLGSGGAAAVVGNSAIGNVPGGGSTVVPTGNNTLSNTGSDAAHNNVQPTLILNYIIKT